MSGPRSRCSILWLAACVLLFWGLSISSARRKSATYDEPVYIVAGLSYLQLGDFTMKDDAPPLIGYLAGISPLAHGLAIPGGKLDFTDSFGNEYDFARQLLYGADADSILFWARMAILLPFSLLLCFSVWVWSGAMFGQVAACVATLLTAASPNIIAHARLVAADVPSAATMTFACYQLFLLMQQRTTRRAVAVGLAVGLALVTKFTALMLLPVLLVALALLAYRHEDARGRKLAGLALVIAAPILLITTVIYGSFDVTLYWRGVANIYRNIRSGYEWYYFGEFQRGGIWHYYFGTLAVKASIPLLLLGMSSLFLLRRRGCGLLAETVLLLPALLLLAAAANDAVSSGLRRVVFVLPVLAISGSRWAKGIDGPRSRAVLPLGLVLAWHLASCLLVWPHYLPYFNEIAGGRAGGHRLLDDSNLDWGQDLKALPAVLERYGIARVYLLYHGQASPEYHGIPAVRVSPPQLARPAPGCYAVSLHLLVRMQGTPSDWLAKYRPFDRAGTSILLFRMPQR